MFKDEMTRRGLIANLAAAAFAMTMLPSQSSAQPNDRQEEIKKHIAFGVSILDGSEQGSQFGAAFDCDIDNQPSLEKAAYAMSQNIFDSDLVTVTMSSFRWEPNAAPIESLNKFAEKTIVPDSGNQMSYSQAYDVLDGLANDIVRQLAQDPSFKMNEISDKHREKFDCGPLALS